jgi:hypothetical protein
MMPLIRLLLFLNNKVTEESIYLINYIFGKVAYNVKNENFIIEAFKEELENFN